MSSRDGPPRPSVISRSSIATTFSKIHLMPRLSVERPEGSSNQSFSPFPDEILVNIIRHVHQLIGEETDENASAFKNSKLFPQRLVSRQFCRVISGESMIPLVQLSTKLEVIDWLRRAPDRIPFFVDIVQISLDEKSHQVLERIGSCDKLELVQDMYNTPGESFQEKILQKDWYLSQLQRWFRRGDAVPLMLRPTVQPFFNALKQLSLSPSELDLLIPRQSAEHDLTTSLLLPSLSYLGIFFLVPLHRTFIDYHSGLPDFLSTSLPALKEVALFHLHHSPTIEPAVWDPRLLSALASIGPKIQTVLLDFGISTFASSPTHTKALNTFLSSLVSPSLTLKLVVDNCTSCLLLARFNPEIDFWKKSLQVLPSGSIKSLHILISSPSRGLLLERGKAPLWAVSFMCDALMEYESLAKLNKLLFRRDHVTFGEVQNHEWVQQLDVISRKRSMQFKWWDSEDESWRVMQSQEAASNN